MMKKLVLLAATACVFATPAKADHMANLDTPYATRGACESAVAVFNAEDADMVLANFPTFFDGNGEVRSFLNRAWQCALADDGNWYISNHIIEVLGSDWYLRRQK